MVFDCVHEVEKGQEVNAKTLGKVFEKSLDHVDILLSRVIIGLEAWGGFPPLARDLALEHLVNSFRNRRDSGQNFYNCLNCLELV